jgi:xylan 1,4-beta-xylosidase
MTTVQNPILPGCYPDPSICRVGTDFYLVNSTFEYFPGLPIFHSTDLVHWTQLGHVITRADQLDYSGIASSGGLYAPTIRHHDDKFWLVCTLVDPNDATRGGNFLVTADDPAGPWSDPIWLDVAGIDPSIFFDDDGRIWMHGTRPAPRPQWEQQTEVWVREYDPVAQRLIGEETIIWNGAMLGVVWAEGPHLYKIRGSYFLLAAEGGTEIHHSVAIARSASVTGPYESNKCNPVLTHRHLGREVDVVGAGHADLVKAADGSWWAFLLAMRIYGGYHYPLGRETFLVPVTWQDGWPVFAPGVGRIPATVEVPFASDLPLGAVQGAVGGPVPPDDLRWTTLRGPADGFATVEHGAWRLRPSTQTLNDAGTPAFLGIRQQHRNADFVATLVPDLGVGEEAGLVIRQGELDHVRFGITPVAEGLYRVSAVHRRAGADSVLGSLTIGEGPFRLAIKARGREYTLTCARTESDEAVVAHADASSLDTIATGGFLGLWLGIYTQTDGQPGVGSVLVDKVEYRPVPDSEA